MTKRIKLSTKQLHAKAKAQNDLLAWTINQVDLLLSERPDVMLLPAGAALSVMVHQGLTHAGQPTKHDHRFPYAMAKSNAEIAKAMGTPEALASAPQENSDGQAAG